MSVAKDLKTLPSEDPAIPKEALVDHPDDVVCPPTDLYSDEPPLETTLHLQQMLLLISCLNWLWRHRDDYFATGNLTIYYNEDQLKSRDFRGPDFFVVLGTEKKPRRSWTVWGEGGKFPNVIVELLSSSTADVDRGLKKDIYQDIFRTPDYFWFDPDSLEFRGFHLIDGRYEPLQPNAQELLWSQQLELYLGIHQRQLRFFHADGGLVPTPEEDAQQAVQRAQDANQRAQDANQRAQDADQRAQDADRRAEAERQRNELLVAKLRELGIDPDNVPE